MMMMSHFSSFVTPASSYTLGLIFIILVSVIWAASSILVQWLYQSDEVDFDSPFWLTYLGVSLFVILLPLDDDIMDWVRTTLQEKVKTAAAAITCLGRNEDDHVIDPSIVTSQRNNHCLSHESLDVTNETNIPFENEEEQQQLNSHSNWTIRDHWIAAAKIAPVWFLSNYAYAASLRYTSITSSTVLASTGSLFTFLFAVLSHDEVFSYTKGLGVALGVAGSLITTLSDAEPIDARPEDESGRYRSLLQIVRMVQSTTDAFDDENGNHDTHNSEEDTYVWGDILGLTSAVGYGVYALMVRLLLPHDESKMRMHVFLGFVGLWNAVSLSPVALYLMISPWFSNSGEGDNSHDGTSTTTHFTVFLLGCLIVKGLLDNVLSDYLWARAVVLTSATVATVGLGLTIPLAFLSDIFWMGNEDVLQPSSIFGALAVLAGFVLVNIGQRQEENENWNSNEHFDANGEQVPLSIIMEQENES